DNIINPTFFIYLLSSFLLSSWLAMHFLVNDWLDEYPSFRQQNMDNSNFVIKLDSIRRNSRNQSLPSPNRRQLPNSQGSNSQVFNSQSFTSQSNNLSGNRLDSINQSANQLTSQLPNNSSNDNDVNQYFGATILNELEKVLGQELAEQAYLTRSPEQLKSRIMSNFDTVKKNLSGVKETKFWQMETPQVISSESGYQVKLKLRWKGPKLEENDFYLTRICFIQSSLNSFINQQNTVGAIHELPLLDWSNNYNNSDINKFKRNNLYKFTPVSQVRKPPVLGPGCLDPTQPTTDQHGKPIPESQLKRSLRNCEKPLKPVKPIPPKTHIPEHKPLPENHRPVNEFTTFCFNPNISDLSKKLRQCPQFASPHNRGNNADKLQKIYSGWNNQDLPKQDINNNFRLNNPNNSRLNNSNNPNNLPNINNQNRGTFNRPNLQNNQTNKEPFNFVFPRLPKFMTNFLDFLKNYFPPDQPNNLPNNNPNNTNPNDLNNNSQIGNNPNNNLNNNTSDNLALPINTNIIKCETIKKEIIPNTTE
ncbi:MAG: DUF5357 family protein, partial [Microcoleaceae cyanobacterium]